MTLRFQMPISVFQAGLNSRWLKAAAIMGALTAAPAFAQQPPPGLPGSPGVPGQPAPSKPAKPATPKPPKPESTVSAPTGGDTAGLRQRIEGLEEQLVDMQVVIGTLETLAKSNGAASASPAYRSGGPVGDAGGSGVDTARVVGLEAQVRSLTQQVQQLTEQVRAVGGQPGLSAQPGLRRDGAANPGSVPTNPEASRYGSSGTAPSQQGWGTATAPAAANRAEGGGFGAGITDTSSGTLPPIAAASPPGDPGGAKQAYEAAYQYLLQQDYGAAEVAFDDFLKRYPSDTLAGNAQFWLGESHFVRGQFKAAAAAFLKGYQSYGRSSKAPDSLLKLAMSLGRLGQKDAACSSLAELGTKFPSATGDVKSRAVAEKQRTGCL